MFQFVDSHGLRPPAIGRATKFATVLAQPRILLVEDKPELVSMLTGVLSEHGYEVRTAATIKDALRAAADWVELAVVDVGVATGQGTELAVRLKEQSPDCEVVLLTGLASVESAAAAVRARAWAYLVKPCPVPELFQTFDAALRSARSQADQRSLGRDAQLAERLAGLATLTAGLSHEIRNPLNNASLQLAVLERMVQKLGEPALLRPLNRVREEIHRLDDLVEDFLQFARPARFSPRPVPLRELIEKVISSLTPEARQRGLQLSHSCPAPSVARGDEHQLHTALKHLCVNALDATPRGGSVSVSCAGLEQQCIVHVDDSGPGIPEEVGWRIFEPFFTTKADRSGLGLPISNAIITHHGGGLTFGPSPLGGTRFSMSLPRA